MYYIIYYKLQYYHHNSALWILMFSILKFVGRFRIKYFFNNQYRPSLGIMNKANNRGIVLCFLIYIVLCAAIVSIIEVPWVILPAGTEISVSLFVSHNKTQDSRVVYRAMFNEIQVAVLTEQFYTFQINVTIQAQTDGETQPLNSNKWPTDIPGSCGKRHIS